MTTQLTSLCPIDILKLIGQYIEGYSAAELARIWNIHRNTIVAHMNSHRAKR